MKQSCPGIPALHCAEQEVVMAECEEDAGKEQKLDNYIVVI